MFTVGGLDDDEYLDILPGYLPNRPSHPSNAERRIREPDDYATRLSRAGPRCAAPTRWPRAD